MRKKLLLPFVLLLLVAISVSAATPQLAVKRKLSDNRKFALFEKNQRPVIKTSTYKVKSSEPLPYTYSFESSDVTTDGWLISDDADLISTYSDSSAPVGESFLVSDYDSSAPRNAWIFSPGITLSAGVTYYVSIYVNAPGWEGIEDEFRITAGTAQTSDAQTTVLIDKSGASKTTYDSWTKLTASFTPGTSGDYYFGINVNTSENDVNTVSFDGFAVNQGAEYFFPPEAALFLKDGGLWSVTSDDYKVYLSPNEAINYTATIKSADSYLWTFQDGNPGNSEDLDVSVAYLSEGPKTADFEANGSGGSVTVSSELTITRPTEKVTDDVWNFNSTDDVANYLLDDYNYAIGLNGYYSREAELYTLPSDVAVTLNSIGFFVAQYKMDEASDRAKKVVVSIDSVGSDGFPGNPIATYTTTFEQLFGVDEIGSATLKSFTLPTPLNLKGSFFIDVDFSDNNTAASETNNLGIYSTSARYTDHNTTFIQYDYKDVISWYTSTKLLQANISSAIVPNLSFSDPNTAVDQHEDSKLKVYYVAGKLNIENASAGSLVNMYDVAGKVVYTNVVSAQRVQYPVSAGKGVYFVKVGDRITKVAVN